MTDSTPPSGTPDAALPRDDDADKPGSPSNKGFWLGMGIGSAALVAALMYARRPKRRK